MAAPRVCANMDEVRAEIDRLDRLIVPLLAERLAYVGQAAGFKPTPADTVVPWRIEEVVANARALARAAGMDEATAERVYRALVDASIDFERREWHRLRGSTEG